MLLGYIAFINIFGTHNFPNTKDAPISKLTESLMGPDFKTLRDSGIDAAEELVKRKSEELEISSSDGLKLKALYFENDKKTDKTVILVHGHSSYGMKDSPLKALGYMKAGFNALLPDNRACGKSEGKWETFGAKESEDILCWINRLVKENPNVKIVVDGCSLGGATVCMLSDKNLPENVRVLVSDCAFTSVDEEFRYMFKRFAHLPAFPLIYTMNFWNKRLNHLGYKDQMPIESVKNARVPMVFVHGTEDRYIPVENAKRLYSVCPADKILILIDNAGHAASCVKGQDKYFKPVFEFIEKYI